MKETNDPSEVFAQYAEGVEVHEDKSITINENVQRDILNATAMLMHEVNKLSSILGLFLRVVQEGELDEVEKVCGLVEAYLDNPEDVTMMQATDPEQVAEILNTIAFAAMGEDDEVEN